MFSVGLITFEVTPAGSMLNLRSGDHPGHVTRMNGRYRNGVFANQKHAQNKQQQKF